MRHRTLLGVLYFCLYTFLVNAYFFSPLLLPRDLNPLRYGFIILAAVVWVISSYPMFFHVRRGITAPMPMPQVPDDPTDAES